MSAKLCGVALLVVALFGSSDAVAQQKRSSDARELFKEGVSLVQKAQWAEALAAFTAAEEITPHAITTYNIGACERAMGHYTRAQARFRNALEQHEASGRKDLPDPLVAETKTFLEELDKIVVRARIHFEPVSATLAIDGRPLSTLDPKATPPVLVAGLRPSGAGEVPPSTDFVVLIDPGVHLLLFSQKGFTNGVTQRTFHPGESISLDLRLERLPAHLRIASNRQPRS